MQTFNFNNLPNIAAKNKAAGFMGADYGAAVTKLHYSQNFAPHKVAYYESLITAIVTRDMNFYQFDINGQLLNPVMNTDHSITI